MEKVVIEDADNGLQAFVIRENNEKLAEMVFSVEDRVMTVYHTGVYPTATEKGLGKTLLEAMVAHARSNGWKVIPFCVFVNSQFRRHPELYADIWQKS